MWVGNILNRLNDPPISSQHFFGPIRNCFSAESNAIHLGFRLSKALTQNSSTKMIVIIQQCHISIAGAT